MAEGGSIGAEKIGIKVVRCDVCLEPVSIEVCDIVVTPKNSGRDPAPNNNRQRIGRYIGRAQNLVIHARKKTIVDHPNHVTVTIVDIREQTVGDVDGLRGSYCRLPKEKVIVE